MSDVGKFRHLISDIEGGFPHSEIRGSKLLRSSSRLIAAQYVLRRLSAPRHPPNALKTLDRSHYRCPSTTASLSPNRHDLERPACFIRSIQRRGGQASPTFQLSATRSLIANP